MLRRPCTIVSRQKQRNSLHKRRRQPVGALDVYNAPSAFDTRDRRYTIFRGHLQASDRTYFGRSNVVCNRVYFKVFIVNTYTINSEV